MYINRKQPNRRGPVAIAFAAFFTTLFLIFGYAFVTAPERLASAFSLPQLLTRTPTLIGEFETTPTRVAATRRPTQTRTPTPTPTPMATVAPTATPHGFVEHFVFDRPVAPDAPGPSPDRYYLYGTTRRGDLEVHHGEEFVNPLGTTLLAVADATVVVAGPDDLPQCGAGGNEICGRKPDYYGNVIILKLDTGYKGAPLYTAYGHVQKWYVRPGQHVTAGEPIGEVGQAGIALGPHVHFETRLGANSYASTRNSILWMRPLPGTGALAGRLQDLQGNPIRNATVLLYADDPDSTYIGDTETYSRDEYPPVNPDEVLGENWAFPDLPAGNYLVRAYDGSLIYSRRITISPGRLTFLIFGG